MVQKKLPWEKESEFGEIFWKNAEQRKIFEYYPKLYPSQIKFNIIEPILDIGGGSGTFLKFLGIKKATILDASGEDSLVGDYEFIKTDITKKLQINKKFKTIFIMETLEHINNPLYLMAQVYDILDDEGICYISIPYTRLNPNRTDGLNSHVCRWRDNEIKTQLEKLGFKVKFIFKRRTSKDKLLGISKVYIPYPCLICF